MDIIDYLFLEKQYDIIITKKKSSCILPFCDILVSYGSSICFWAPHANVISINVKLINEVEEFSYLDSTYVANSEKDYRNYLSDLINDNEIYAEASERVANDAKKFRPLDGRNSIRYTSLYQPMT